MKRNPRAEIFSNVEQLLMRLPLVWSIYLVPILVCSLMLANERGAPPVRPKIQQGQVRKLLRRYTQAKTDAEQQSSIVDEAIDLGLPFSGALRNLVGQHGALVFRRYRTLFARNIESARRVTPEDVVASRKYLVEMRNELLRLAEFARRLEQPLPASGVDVGEEGKEGEAEEGEPEPEFTEHLKKTEEELLLHWMRSKGYGQLGAAESALVAEVNRRREREGLKPLTVDFKLSLAARDHSWDMLRKRFFSHRSKIPGKKTYTDCAHRFGVTAGAENIASCAHAAEAISLWMASTGHRRNILNPSFRRVGAGRAGKKFTIMFGY